MRLDSAQCRPDYVHGRFRTGEESATAAGQGIVIPVSQTPDAWAHRPVSYNTTSTARRPLFFRPPSAYATNSIFAGSKSPSFL
ncbi:hypothetical protein BDZ85DRAFT_28716 [Elsinoe ampelina]|uniref:Uncharacterized protein n=1 Tax=Elsinoe ampelina TaxID=302913 RepID=A0A6A6G4B9_9PEZI|nr:hypothetical protein BDZ85DRAFT_28716 [Elsinoe ampelina]